MGIIVPFIEQYTKHLDMLFAAAEANSYIEPEQLSKIALMLAELVKYDLISNVNKQKITKAVWLIAERLPNKVEEKVVYAIIKVIEVVLERKWRGAENFIAICISFGYMIQRVYESPAAEQMHPIICKILSLAALAKIDEFHAIIIRILFEILHQCSVSIDTQSAHILIQVTERYMNVADAKLRMQIAVTINTLIKKASKGISDEDLYNLIKLTRKMILWNNQDVAEYNDASIVYLTGIIAARKNPIQFSRLTAIFWHMTQMSHSCPKHLRFLARAIIEFLQAMRTDAMPETILCDIVDLVIFLLYETKQEEKILSIVALGCIVQKLPEKLPAKLRKRAAAVLDAIGEITIDSQGAQMLIMVIIIEILKKI